MSDWKSITAAAKRAGALLVAVPWMPGQQPRELSLACRTVAQRVWRRRSAIRPR